MTSYLALLRAVNLGPHNRVAMSDLRDLLTGLGFSGAQTLLQSGNAVFSGPARATDKLEHLLEQEAGKRLGVRTAFFVRTAKEWQAVVAGNPFREHAARDPGHLVVMLLRTRPALPLIEQLQASVTGPELVRAGERHAYIVYPAGMGRSRLTNAVIERKLGSPSTARNWNTVLKLGALVK